MMTKTRAPLRLVAACAASLALIAGAGPAAGQTLDQQEGTAQQPEPDFSIQPPYDDADTIRNCNAAACLGDVQADPVTGAVATDMTAAGLGASGGLCNPFSGRPINLCLPSPSLTPACGSWVVSVQAEGGLTGRHQLSVPASSVQVSVPVTIAEGSLINPKVGCGWSSAGWAFTVVAECGVLDDDGQVIPATRRPCQATSTTRQWSGPADVIEAEEAVLTAELRPPAGEVVAPGSITVRARLLGLASIRVQGISAWHWLEPTGGGAAAIRFDLSGTVTRMDGVVAPA